MSPEYIFRPHSMHIYGKKVRQSFEELSILSKSISFRHKAKGKMINSMNYFQCMLNSIISIGVLENFIAMLR